MLKSGELHAANELARPLARLQLIALALLVGVIVFAGVALTLGPKGPAGTATTAPVATGTAFSTPMLMRIIWGVLALTQVPLAFFIVHPFIKRAAVIRRSDSSLADSGRSGSSATAVHGPTFTAFSTSGLISLALLESLALLGAITLLMSGDPIDLLLVGAPTLLMLAVFPTAGRWHKFDRAAAGESHYSPRMNVR